MKDKFELISPFSPQGDQPQAIEALVAGLKEGKSEQVLLGVTGSGKTYTVAKVIEAVNRPTLVIAHNKTLAAQLFQEFREFFPKNAVEYFVSYYDYYQPEAYLPATDTYIEKDSMVNDEIDRMRHSATRAIYERRDVIVVASVSCIYGLGSPESYYQNRYLIMTGAAVNRDEFLTDLVGLQYQRTDGTLERGKFRVRGDVVDLFPSFEELALRIEFFGDSIDSLSWIDPLTGKRLDTAEHAAIYPRTHYVTSPQIVTNAAKSIKAELDEYIKVLSCENKFLEAERIQRRTLFDLEMMNEIGYCSGIENYSRHLEGRLPGTPPNTLLDYMQDDFLVVIDESHQTIPQVRGMYNGDQARKTVLVNHGFRLPSALDNRPLTFDEFDSRRGQTMYISATPAPFELERVGGEFVEQVIRPTGLMDPVIEVRPLSTQVDDLYGEIRTRSKRGERILVTTLTKKMAEDLTKHYEELEIKVRYLHSDVHTLERVEILRDLRNGVFDVLIGVNLLREGLDLPEVSLVAILDADKEGFLRSTTALIQTSGRAARNIEGKVIMYADRVTKSMRAALDETDRRRKRQLEYNKEHGITPKSIQKSVSPGMKGPRSAADADYYKLPAPAFEARKVREQRGAYTTEGDLKQEIAKLQHRMRAAAERLEFEKAANIRDKIKSLKQQELFG